MPENHDEEDLISKIMEIAKDEDGPPTNRVGELYEKLISIFRDPNKLPDNYFRPYTAETLQARPEDWTFNDPCLLVRKISSRQEAIEALVAIAEQGEGFGKPNKDQSCPQSHFEIFLEMFEEYTTAESDKPNAVWVATSRVPLNPNTMPEPFSNNGLEDSRITHHLSLLFAHLFNVHYRMLIMYLSHVLTIEEKILIDSKVKKSICDLTFIQMQFLSEIAAKLIELPLKDNKFEKDGNPELVAAPTFELPPSLTFPDRAEDQWLLHSSLITCSINLIRSIRAESGQAETFRSFVKQEIKHYKNLSELLPEIDLLKSTLNELMQFQL